MVDFVMVDGVRPDAGATRQSRDEKRAAKMVKPDGTPLGWTPAQLAAKRKAQQSHRITRHTP
jgi:hypothetical protein